MQNLTDEIKDLLLTRSLLLQRVSNSLTKDIINAYVSVIDDILAQIATGKNINLINMNKIINELNAKLTPDLTSVNDDLVQLGISEASYIANGINGAIGIDLVSKLPTDRTVQKIVNTSLMDGLTISEWLGKQDKAFQETLTKQIRLAVIEGETNPQIVSRLKGALDIKNNNNIKTIVRTAVATVTSQAREQTYKENIDIFKGWEWNATLDSRTRPAHAAYDGMAHDLNGKGINEKGKKYAFIKAPNGWNCRCISLPITKSFKELGIPLDEVSKGTRSSIDGYVSRDTTFEKWFEGKSKSFQEEYLGKGRYELYKKGTISFSDLVNQNGRTLKISELAKISPVAKVSNIDNSINTINSESIDKATFRLSRYADAVSKNLKTYDIDFVDGTYAGLNEVLGNYKTSGKVTTIGITNKAGAQFVPSSKWQPESHFKVGNFMANYKTETTLSQTTIERWQERINKNIQVNTTGNYAKSKFEYAKILMSHEAWHKVDIDNGLTDSFMKNMHSKGIIKDKLEDYSYKISYYAGKASSDELFAEVGALYSNNRKELIPKEMLQAFEETIEKVKK